MSCFVMFSHPVQVAAQFLWESSARVLVDFSPGAGTLAKTAIAMGLKSILVCHNPAHVKVLTRLLCTDVVADIKDSNSKYSPKDLKERIDALKPERLVAWENRKRSTDDTAATPRAKRQALGSAIETMLAGLDSPGSSQKPKAKAKASAGSPSAPAVPPAPAPAQPASSSSQGPAPSPAEPAATAGQPSKPANPEPAADIQALLKAWA